MMTIVTLADYGNAMYYTNVVHGVLSDEDKAKLAERFGATHNLTDPESSEYAEGRVLYFRTVEPAANADALDELLNVEE